MLPFRPAPGPLRICALGAHCDDIEIGAGGTILRLLDEHPGSTVTWLVASSNPQRRFEAEASVSSFCAAAASVAVSIGDYTENVLPWVGADVKRFFAARCDAGDTDLVVAPRPDDLHQDHRLVAEVALQTFRDHPILGYEIAKYDGDLRTPNVYVGLDDQHVDRKIEALFRHFGSQLHRPWFDELAFRGLLRIRGIECNRTWAEGFHVHKLAW